MINNLIMLPINRKPVGGDIILNSTNNVLFIISEFTIHVWDNCDHLIPQQLYILANADIKEGDWCMIKDEPQQVISFNASVLPELKNKYGDTLCTCYNIQIGHYECFPESLIGKKIIASTDPLLKLPQIPKSFIKYFISEWNKGNKIEKVNVVYDLFWNNRRFKHQPFPDEFATEKDRVYELKVNPDNIITINI